GAMESGWDEEGQGMPLIGIAPSHIPVLWGVPRASDPPYSPESPAAKAKLPLRNGDQIIATTDPANPNGPLSPLPLDPRMNDGEQRDFFALIKRFTELADKPITLRVEHTDGGTDDVVVPPSFTRDLGLVMRMGKITAVRGDSPAHEGDRITQVEVEESRGDATPATGKRILRFVASPSATPPEGVREVHLDPSRLPMQLKKWAQSYPGEKT